MAAGDQIIIAKGGRPLAKLVPLGSEPERSLGTDRGLFAVPADFDAPLPDDVIAESEQ